ncbi:MAG TPA: hypothetical protein VL294_01730 [Pseudolysinimonas sp.]|jgi:hypothetical protein|nr:hypothetical protein [Pseudolysinimonas sp.]
MSEIVYEISGLPWLAVRLGRALERWGTRSARPVPAERVRRRVTRHLATEAAVEARRAALVDMHPYLRAR